MKKPKLAPSKYNAGILHIDPMKLPLTSAIFTPVLAGLCFLLSVLADARLAAPPPEVEAPVASSHTTEPAEGLIKLDVVVTGQNGIPVGGLARKISSCWRMASRQRYFPSVPLTKFLLRPTHRLKLSLYLINSNFPSASFPEDAMR
jgi:hypothetical protein